MTTDTDPSPQRGLLGDLLHRRVPQFLGAYLLGSVAFLEGVSWVQEQYLLAPRLNHLAGVLIVSLIPTILLLAYEHGAPGRQVWTPRHRIALTVCLLLCTGVVGSQVRSGDFSKMTETVLVENEDGEEEAREVPKADYRRRIVLFAFENLTDDPDQTWLTYSIPTMVHFDLMQNVFITSYSWFINEQSFLIAQNAGFTPTDKLPLGMQREIANSSGINYMISGAYRYEQDQLIVETRIVSARTGKTIATETIEASDIWSAVDALSNHVKKGLGIPTVALEGVADLPVKELTTSNREALRIFWEGVAQFANREADQAITTIERALELDPSFAFAHYQLSAFCLFDNQLPRAEQALIDARKHRYKFPERIVYYADALHAQFIEKDIPKAHSIFKTLTRLYPSDVIAKQALTQIYMAQRRIDEAISVCKDILELDPGSRETMVLLGTLYESKGDSRSAVEIYEKMIAGYPTSADGYTHLGDLYAAEGDVNRANEAYDKAAAIEPDRFDLYPKRARLFQMQGRFREAETLLLQAETMAGNINEKAQALQELKEHYDLLGQTTKAVEQVEKVLVLLENAPAYNRLIYSLSMARVLAEGGKSERASEMVEQLRSEFQPPFDKLAVIGLVRIASVTEDLELLTSSTEELAAHIRNYQAQSMMHVVAEGRGRAHEIKGEYDKALESYQEFRDLTPSAHRPHRLIARTLRNLGRLEEAEQHLQHALNLNPYNPRANYEAALYYRARGDMTKAREHLDRTLEVWKDAEPGHIPTIRARQTAEAWETGT